MQFFISSLVNSPSTHLCFAALQDLTQQTKRQQLSSVLMRWLLDFCVCVCVAFCRDCMIFVSMQPWFLLSLPYSEVILMVSPQKWRSSVFPYELFLWSPSYGFSVPSMSSVKNSPLQEIWAHSDEPFVRWTKNTKTYIDKRHLSHFQSSFQHISAIHIHIHVI